MYIIKKMSFLKRTFNELMQYKSFIISLFIIIIMKFIKFFWKNKKKIEDDYIKFESMTIEEQKLFLITKFNTCINRNDPKEREKFIKKCKNLFLFL